MMFMKSKGKDAAMNKQKTSNEANKMKLEFELVDLNNNMEEFLEK